jgi:hypothetical protein
MGRRTEDWLCPAAEAGRTLVMTLLRRPVVTDGAWLRLRGDADRGWLLCRGGRRGAGCAVFGGSPIMTQFLPRSSERSVCRLLAAGRVGVDARLSLSKGGD